MGLTRPFFIEAGFLYRRSCCAWFMSCSSHPPYGTSLFPKTMKANKRNFAPPVGPSYHLIYPEFSYSANMFSLTCLVISKVLWLWWDFLLPHRWYLPIISHPTCKLTLSLSLVLNSSSLS